MSAPVGVNAGGGAGGGILTDHSREALEAVRAELLKTAESLGARAAEAARAKAPVRTGRLRDSIRYEVVGGENSIEAVIGSDVPYAAAQELGTVRMPGKHFLRDAVAAAAGSMTGKG